MKQFTLFQFSYYENWHIVCFAIFIMWNICFTWIHHPPRTWPKHKLRIWFTCITLVNNRTKVYWHISDVYFTFNYNRFRKKSKFTLPINTAFDTQYNIFITQFTSFIICCIRSSPIGTRSFSNSKNESIIRSNDLTLKSDGRWKC